MGEPLAIARLKEEESSAALVEAVRILDEAGGAHIYAQGRFTTTSIELQKALVAYTTAQNDYQFARTRVAAALQANEVSGSP